MAKRKIIIPPEFDIQVTLREYMIRQYSHILMRCDLGGIRLPIGLAKKTNRLNPWRAWPNIFIAEPRGKYHSLFIELKKSTADLYRKNGSFRQTQHLEEQRHILQYLQRKGYKAIFACGFDEAKNIVDDYLDRRT